MKPEHKKGTILNASHEVVSCPKDNIEDFNLPPGTQALIEARLSLARAELRETIQADFLKFADERTRGWKKLTLILGVLLFAVGGFNWFFSSERVEKMVNDWASKNLVEDPLRTRIDRILKEKSDAWATERFAPLDNRTRELSEKIALLTVEIGKQQERLRDDQMKTRQRTDDLTKQIAHLSTEIGEQQESLRLEQSRIREQVSIQDLAVAARVGDSVAWIQLCAFSQQNTPISKNAKAAKIDVEQYYSTDRYKLTGVYAPVDPITQKGIKLPLEEALRRLTFVDASARNSAANELHDLKLTCSTGALCRAVSTEADLRVVARISRALQEITGTRFDPLDKEKIAAWWAKNQDRKEYDFPLEKFEAGRMFFIPTTGEKTFHLGTNRDAALKSIPLLEEVLRNEPNGANTRTYLCLARLAVGDKEGALREHSAIENTSNGRHYWRTPMARAIIAAQNGDREKAIEALNAAFDISPFYAGSNARELAVFKEYRDAPNVKWPKQ